MLMYIGDFFKFQEKNNDSIILDSNLCDYKIKARKHLELNIKMSELADVTKCYKYWVGDEPSLDKKVILDKYISCLKHIINLAIDDNYYIEDLSVEECENCLSDQFLGLYIDISDLIMSSTQDHYITLLEDYLSLGNSLDISSDEMLNALKKSN
ncbi:MAG: dUTP diphosphatase [Clostridium sp.]|nr:dUTP diphosphatase [Clostridium sp.]MDY3828934.1 dUTP diphosphatase [Clostridium sp.]